MNPVTAVNSLQKPAGPAAPHQALPGSGVQGLLLLALAVALLYVPTVWSLWNTLWQDRTHSH
ncbi:MAG: hypothetical protein ACOVOG_00480, partial [Rubrivivax sp.]